MEYTYNDGALTIIWDAEAVELYGTHPVIFPYYGSRLQAIAPVLDSNDNPTVITVDGIPELEAKFAFVKADNQSTISLAPGQTEAGFTTFANKITVSANNGALTILWNNILRKKHGNRPYVVAYFNGQYQVVTPMLDNLTNPTTITINLGTIPTTNTHLIFV